MVDMLGFISDQLDQLGIPYEFGEWPGCQKGKAGSCFLIYIKYNR